MNQLPIPPGDVQPQSESMHPPRRCSPCTRKLAAAILFVLGGVVVLVWVMQRLTGPVPVPPSVDLRKSPRLVADAIRSARQQVEDSPHSDECWGRLGMWLFAHEFEREALICFLQAEQLNPQAFRWHYYRGLLLSVQDREAAVSAFEQALGVRGDYAPARLRLAELYFDLGELGLAEEQLSRAENVAADSPRLHLDQARLALRRGNLPESERCAKVAVRLAPHCRDIHEFLAALYQRLGNRAAARPHLDRLPELPQTRLVWDDPIAAEVVRLRTDADGILSDAEGALARGDVAYAVERLQALVDRDPGVSRAYAMLGRALTHAGRLTQAADVLRDGAERHPNSAEVRFQFGVVLFLLQRFAEAETEFEAAVGIKPDYPPAWYNLGHAHERLGDTENALAAFRNAVRFRPDSVDAHMNLGRLLALLNRPDEALQHFKTVLELQPIHREALDSLHQLNAEAPASATD